MSDPRKGILLVDADPVSLERLTACLEQEGFYVLTAGDGAEGLALARQVRFSMVITDLLLPGVDGFELTWSLWGDPAFVDLPILWMASDWGSEELLGRLRSAMARRAGTRSPILLQKPIRSHELVSLVLGLTGQSHATPTQERVLIIDDDHANLEMLEQRLAAEGISSVMKQTGMEGVEAAQAERFDAILLDLRLPDLDGFEILSFLRQQHPTLPIIVMTAHGSEAIAVKALTEGATHYLIKPFNRKDLIHVLRGAISRSKTSADRSHPDSVHLLSKRAATFKPISDHADAGSMKTASIEELSHREIEIVTLMAQGLENKEIAEKLVLSEKTVGNHLSRIYEKLKVTNRTQAVVTCLQLDLIAPVS